jgi:hypothetical protein
MFERCKLEDVEDELVIWTGHVNAKMEQQLMKFLRNKQMFLDSS